MTTKAATALIPRFLSAPLFLVGPVLSIIALKYFGGGHFLPGVAVGPACWSALMVWSPSPISIPALVMQDVRDAYAPQMHGIVGTIKRGVLITFWLAGKDSPVRVEMQAARGWLPSWMT